MKQKLALINFTLMLTVLFAMLAQSFHSYEHLAQQLRQKQCAHKYSHKTEFTHHHIHFDDCFVCEFTFAHFTAPDIYAFGFRKADVPTKYTFSFSREITQFFRGSLFSHRGPPSFIV